MSLEFKAIQKLENNAGMREREREREREITANEI
jgi:hypothetical protein